MTTKFQPLLHGHQCDQMLELKVAQIYNSCLKNNESSFFLKSYILQNSKKVAKYLG